MQKKRERWGSWLWFSLSSSFLFQAKTMFLKAGSCLKHKAKENRQGLVSLYRDLEVCSREYRDIRVMWELIQSSRPPPNRHEAAVSRRRWRFVSSRTRHVGGIAVVSVVMGEIKNPI